MKFEIYKDDAGEWRWRLKAANGKVVAQGEGYKRITDCSKAVRLLQESADAEVERIKEAC